MTKDQKATDIYAQVTNKIIADLEKGELTWRQPWNKGGADLRVVRPLRWQGTPYTGINTIMLWIAAREKGYASPYWMTYKQALDMKAHVGKGEKASIVVYEEANPEGGLFPQTACYLKQCAVFNAGQVDGLPGSYYRMPDAPHVNPEQRVAVLERIFSQTKGKKGDAKEELVAELGACFLAADLGFEPVTREEHAAYIQSWLAVLKHDKRFIFHAAALAQRAVEFVNSLQPEASATPEPAPAPQSIFTKDTRIPARPPLPAPGPKPAPPRPPAPFRPKL